MTNVSPSTIHHDNEAASRAEPQDAPEIVSQTVSADDTCACATSDRHSESYAADKAKILARLRRIEGQVRGVQRMVEDDKYCIDILTQLSAIIASARATGLVVLEDHIRGCVVNGDPNEREATLAELNGAIERFVRSVGNS